MPARIISRHDFWFPDIELPVGCGQVRTATQLPVLTMITGYARWLSAVLIPTRTAEDPSVSTSGEAAVALNH